LKSDINVNIILDQFLYILSVNAVNFRSHC